MPPRSQDITHHARAVAFDDAGVVGVDSDDPASILERAEEEAAHPVPPERGDVAAMLMQHLFDDGPHPAHVTMRLYRLTEAVAPELLRALPWAERRALPVADPSLHEWRLGILLRGTRIAKRRPATHQAIVREVLAAAWAKHRSLLMVREVPAAALTDYQAADRHEVLSQFMARREAVVGLLSFFFHDGPAPQVAVRRVFMVAKAFYEALVLGMSLEQLGRMFGQTRATWSWRGRKKLNAFLAARGVQAVQAPYQKSAGTVEKLAIAARGNRNRATGRRCVA
jgi:hypothetical protein